MSAAATGLDGERWLSVGRWSMVGGWAEKVSRGDRQRRRTGGRLGCSAGRERKQRE